MDRSKIKRAVILTVLIIVTLIAIGFTLTYQHIMWIKIVGIITALITSTIALEMMRDTRRGI
jgi:uncharacterized membrane protein